MVSFWPWKGQDTSPASFEKALSNLTEKIAKSSTRLENLRQRSRRVTGLWTLYSIFIYLLYSVILILVVGWRNWGASEFVAVAIGPFISYLVRLGLLSYYHHRTSAAQSQLDDLQGQRDETIRKLKAATKYDTTQELLKKYSGTPSPKQKAPGGPDRKKSPKQGDSGTPQNGRTAFIPPPTANIPGRSVPSPPPATNQHPSLAQDSRPLSPIGQSPIWQQDRRFQEPTAEFAPNAFPSAPQYAPANDGPRWYDRFMDLLMGEDETLPGRRLALICNNCRLVNGLAPPGKQRLEDVGKWRCAACKTMNGEDNDVDQIMASIQKRKPAASPAQDQVETKLDKPETKTEEVDVESPPEDESEESDITQYDTDEGDVIEEHKEEQPKNPVPAEGPRRRSTRVKAGQKKTNS